MKKKKKMQVPGADAMCDDIGEGKNVMFAGGGALK